MAVLTNFMLYSAGQNILQPDGNQIYTGINPIFALKPDFIPTFYTFAHSFVIQDIDETTEHFMKIEIKTPDNTVVFVMNDKLKGFLPDKSNIPENYKGYILSGDIVNLKITEEGIYKFTVTVDDEEIGYKEIPIYRKAE